MAMQWNDQQVAKNFMGGRPQQAQPNNGDRNNNGIPDREEISLKISRPAKRQANPQQGQMPGQPPIATTPVERPNTPNNVMAYFPEGLDTSNFRQFMQTPAGQEHMRQIIDRVRNSMTPQGQQPRRIFDRIMANFMPNKGA